MFEWCEEACSDYCNREHVSYTYRYDKINTKSAAALPGLIKPRASALTKKSIDCALSQPRRDVLRGHADARRRSAPPPRASPAAWCRAGRLRGGFGSASVHVHVLESERTLTNRVPEDLRPWEQMGLDFDVCNTYLCAPANRAAAKQIEGVCAASREAKFWAGGMQWWWVSAHEAPTA